VDLLFGRVMQDVQAHRAPLELAHGVRTSTTVA
jgi:hypothetical protein